MGFTEFGVACINQDDLRETMSIFDWLKTPKTNVDLLDDVIVLTKQAKVAGLSAATARCLAERTVSSLSPRHFPRITNPAPAG